MTIRNGATLDEEIKKRTEGAGEQDGKGMQEFRKIITPQLPVLQAPLAEAIFQTS